MTTVYLASALGTVPTMMILLLMTLALVPSLLFICNTKKKRENAEAAKREKEKEDAKKKKEREAKEEEDIINAIVGARIQAEDDAYEKKREEEKAKDIAELVKKGASQAAAEIKVTMAMWDRRDFTCESDRERYRSKMVRKVRAELKRKQEKVRKKRSQDREDFGKFEKDLMSCEDKKDTFSAQETKSNEKINASPEKPEKKKDVITKVTNSNEKIAPTLVK